MRADIDRILIPQDRIAARVRELAGQITADHAEPEAIMCVAILTGAMIFCADLIRQMPIAMKIGLMTVSSYPGTAVQSQGSKLRGTTTMAEQLGDIAGRHVVLVDDILDSGGTLSLVVPAVKALGPASVKTCVLLRKERSRSAELAADYVGFDIPDLFVVGYGLDYGDYYRNLPDIVTLKESALDRHA